MKPTDDFLKDTYTKKLLEEQYSESLPDDFAKKIVKQLEPFPAKEKKYKPLLRKENWYLVAAIVFAILVSAWVGSEPTTAPDPLYSNSVGQLVKATGGLLDWFSNVKLSASLVVGILLFWGFFFLDDVLGNRIKLEK